jgi:hypothetical protein
MNLYTINLFEKLKRYLFKEKLNHGSYIFTFNLWPAKLFKPISTSIIELFSNYNSTVKLYTDVTLYI